MGGNCKHLLPFGVYKVDKPEKSLYDSGEISVTQTGNVLHVTMEDFQFAPDGHMVTETQDGQKFASNQGVFTAAMIQIVAEHENVSQTRMYTVDAVVSNVKIKDKNNTKKDVIQTESTDDHSSYQIQTVKGGYNQCLFLSPIDEFYCDGTTLHIGESGDNGAGSGANYGYPGQKLYLTSSSSILSRPNNKFYGIDHLVKFPSIIEPTENLDDVNMYLTTASIQNYAYTILENPLDDVNAYYAVKKDGTGWIDESEMDSAQIEDLLFYETKEEIGESVIVGVLIEARGGSEYVSQYRVCAVLPITISEKAESNQVYSINHGTLHYALDLRNTDIGMTTEHGLTHVNINRRDVIDTQLEEVLKLRESLQEIMKQKFFISSLYGDALYGVFGMEYQYEKALFKNGEVIGGHRAISKSGYSVGEFGGNSLLIVGALANVEKTIEQRENNGNEKTLYNLNQGQREVDFKLQPTYRFAVENDMEDEKETLTITDTLDLGLTYIPGSAVQGGIYDAVTESVIGGTLLEPQINVDAEGRQVLTWILNDVVSGNDIEPIRYSCTIGAQGETNDVKNGDQLSTFVTITAPTDPRKPTETNGKLSRTSIQIVQDKGAFLDKSVDKAYAELADNFTYSISFMNSGSESYNDVLLYDILPYEGDGRGTDFKGGHYHVESIKLCTDSNAGVGDIYVTSMKQKDMKSLSSLYEGIGDNAELDSTVWEGWTKLEEGMELSGITAIAVIGDVHAGQKLSAIINIKIECPVNEAVFANNVHAYTADHQKLASLDVKTTVLPRKLSGLAWFDADRDGIRETGEALLAGVKVTLVDQNGNAVNDIYGNPVNAYVTGADGAYQFDNLAAGEYQVRFESDTYKLDELLVAVKDSSTAGDEWDSDADGVYEGETLKAAVISGIKLPELSAIVEKNLDEWHEAYLDVGFHSPEPDETESDPTESNPTESDPTESDPSESESNELESSEPESSESETTEPETSPSIDDDEDEEPKRTERPTQPTEPTSPVAPTEPTLPTETITDAAPETETLPYVDPSATPDEISWMSCWLQ